MRSRDALADRGAGDDDGQPLSDAQILAHINILLVAGHETTTSLGAWVLYLLATLPEHRRRIAAEIASVIGDTASGPIAVEALRELKQLDNFIKEAGRLYAPVITVPRGVLREVEFGGYTLPAGTPVRLALAASQLLPHVFADPQRFDPDRFAPPREEDRRTPYGLVDVWWRLTHLHRHQLRQYRDQGASRACAAPLSAGRC